MKYQLIIMEEITQKEKKLDFIIFYQFYSKFLSADLNEKII